MRALYTIAALPGIAWRQAVRGRWRAFSAGVTDRPKKFSCVRSFASLVRWKKQEVSS